eukprot:NODE_6256_length_463_cov_11.036232_g4742_i0.p2 GENE.NODE_6256_length_463_cov_11.036232_g4742_i0~~NODE_6256_length_463_cov_11.036232_g4742_i0.p2  ORF type:complete len:130 (-),score=7.35 NODE_6256_length_463_cov_11.036232_g4742_i0:35-424(-)
MDRQKEVEIDSGLAERVPAGGSTPAGGMSRNASRQKKIRTEPRAGAWGGRSPRPFPRGSVAGWKWGEGHREGGPRKKITTDPTEIQQAGRDGERTAFSNSAALRGPAHRTDCGSWGGWRCDRPGQSATP